MTTKSYQRLLKARFSALSRTNMTSTSALALDATLQMPHPLREEAFLKWCQRSINGLEPKLTVAPPQQQASVDC